MTGQSTSINLNSSYFKAHKAFNESVCPIFSASESTKTIKILAQKNDCRRT